MSTETDALTEALRKTRELLERHGERYVSARLAELEARLACGDWTAIASAVSEATGSMGSLNDRVLTVANGDAIDRDREPAVNRRLATLVRDVERTARAAAARHGIHLVR